MKKIKLFSSIFVATIAISAVAPTVSAAPVTLTANSKGKVEFKATDNPDDTITVPETDPSIPVKPPKDGDNGFQAGGGLALIAPKLDFGQHEIKQEEEKFDVKVLEYTHATDSTKKFYLPPMVIVKDLTGDSAGHWEVEATASEFVSSKDPNTKLAGAKIILGANESLLFNNTKTTASNPLPQLGDQNVTADTTNFKLPSNVELSTTAAKVMSAANGKGGGQTTFVPDTSANYDLIKAGNGVHYTADDTVKGIQLHVPAATIRTTDTYTSNLTWTLTNA